MVDASSQTFTAWYQEHFDYVWKTLGRLGIHEHERKDLTQDIFAVAFRQLSSFDPTRPVKPWLFGIAYRRALDFRRKGKLETETLEDQGVLEAELDEQIARKQGFELMQQFIASLDEDKRAVFILHDIDAQTMPVIAEAQGIPLNTAYSRLRLARQSLEEFVKRVQARERRGT